MSETASPPAGLRRSMVQKLGTRLVRGALRWTAYFRDAQCHQKAWKARYRKVLERQAA